MHIVSESHNRKGFVCLAILFTGELSESLLFSCIFVTVSVPVALPLAFSRDPRVVAIINLCGDIYRTGIAIIYC